MKININHFVKGASQAKGICVVIDVFRACSVVCYVHQQNINKYIVSNDLDAIKQFKKVYPDAIYIGKNHELSDPLFNTNNSPKEIVEKCIMGKNIIHNSAGGIVSLISAVNAEEVITGSFVNAKAVAAYIRYKNPKEVTLVASGHLGEKYAIEDVMCAEYIKEFIIGNESEESKIYNNIQKEMLQVFKANNHPEIDFEYCMKFNVFDFVVKLETIDGIHYLKKNKA